MPFIQRWLLEVARDHLAAANAVAARLALIMLVPASAPPLLDSASHQVVHAGITALDIAATVCATMEA